MNGELPEKINLEIVTPDRLLFSGEVDEVRVPGAQGYMGILPGHAPLLSELQIGVVTYRQGAEEHHFFCSWGFLEVLSDRVSVLAETAEAPGQIDRGQVEKELEETEKLLHSRDFDVDVEGAQLRWRLAMTRLEVARKTGAGL